MSKKLITKIIWSAVLAALLAFSYFWLSAYFGSEGSSFYSGLQEKLNARFVSASVIFGITKLVSGVLAFLQSIEIEAGIAVAGFNMSPMEILSPLNSTIDKLSNLFLWAMGAIVLQKMLMYIAGWVAFKIMIPVSCLFLGIFVWTKRIAFRNAAIMLIAFAFTVSATVPLSVLIADGVERHFLADVAAEAMTGIESKEDAISAIQDEFSVAEDKSAWTILKESMSISAIQAKIKGAVDSALEYGKALVTDLLNLFIVTVITVLVIPLATIFTLWMVLRWTARTLSKKITGID